MGVPEIRSTMAGVLRARGALDVKVQKLIRGHCEAGNIEVMAEALAEYLVTDGMVRGSIPQNAGQKTAELLNRAAEAFEREAGEYHEKGGVLLARGYRRRRDLVRMMKEVWINTFGAQVNETHFIKGSLGDPEVQERLTLVALKAREIITETSDTHDSTGTFESSEIRFSEDKLEGLCRRLAAAMFTSFQDPNATNHHLIHGRE